jgi:Carbohydrate esterase, sialic acid-specific acetylesterase
MLVPNLETEDASVLSDASTQEDAAHDAAMTETFDYWGIVHTGQSLANGTQGVPVNQKLHLFGNLMLVDANNTYDNTGGGLALLPLATPIRLLSRNGRYPRNIAGETPAEAMSDQLSALSQKVQKNALVSIPSVVAHGGAALSLIAKQQGPQYPAPNDPRVRSFAYWASLYETTQIQKLAQDAGKRYCVGAIVLTHGETDALIGTNEQTYENGLVDLVKNYQTDLAAITHQIRLPPLLVTQQQTFPPQQGARLRIAVAQHQAAVNHPELITLVGPKYQYEYASDRQHLTAPAYERLGEKNAEVFYRRAVLGERFRPLEPEQVEKTGAQIRVSFYVPHKPLSLREDLGKEFRVFREAEHPWAEGQGFEVTTEAGAMVRIVSVVLDSESSVIITLERDPGPRARLAYAMTQGTNAPTSPGQVGLPCARTGNLRDADPFQPNDAQAFEVSVADTGASISATGAFVRRTIHDRVAFAGVPGEWTITSHTADSAVLDHAVPRRGLVTASFTSDQRNYAISFERLLP